MGGKMKKMVGYMVLKKNIMVKCLLFCFLLGIFDSVVLNATFHFSTSPNPEVQNYHPPKIKDNLGGKIPFQPYFGTNYWYGGFACVDSIKGLRRVRKELDFLKSKGVTMLRVFITADGDSSYAYRVFPSLQPSPKKYNLAILRGFDRFLVEVEKRDMKVVFVLTNNWEWTGGLGQYVEWSVQQKRNSFSTSIQEMGTDLEKNQDSETKWKKENSLLIPPPLPKTESWDWDRYCEYISTFYSDSTAQKWYWDFVKFILQYKSSLDGKKYSEHPAIFAWQLANEPRPMKKIEIENYVNWIEKSAKLIRDLDSNHLISIGVEGKIGLFNSMELFERIHRLPYIDYATIHIWPKTWNWYQGSSSEVFSSDCLSQISEYIKSHALICQNIGIPLVIEEFGLERDANYNLESSTAAFQKSRFSPHSKTLWRDGFYALIFTLGLENNIQGFNFWGYAGIKENVSDNYFMKLGMGYSADPPQEEQGLYSVFRSDRSTWKVIKKFSRTFQNAR